MLIAHPYTHVENFHFKFQSHDKEYQHEGIGKISGNPQKLVIQHKSKEITPPPPKKKKQREREDKIQNNSRNFNVLKKIEKIRKS